VGPSLKHYRLHVLDLPTRRGEQLLNGKAPCISLLACHEVSGRFVPTGRSTYAKRVKRRSSNATIDATKALRKAGKEMQYVVLLIWEELPDWQ
jgi:hypothetical protein